jgi:tRNA-dihydrouridine synthase
VAAVTVHGRTTVQRFRGQVDLPGITEVVEALSDYPGVPVIGNGDIRRPEDAARMLAETGCHGVMIGRGALGQPWLFRDTAHMLSTGTAAPPYPRSERIRRLLDHLDHLVAYEGPRRAFHKLRQRISWYSPHLQPWPNLRRDVQNLAGVSGLRDYLAAALDGAEATADGTVWQGRTSAANCMVPRRLMAEAETAKQVAPAPHGVAEAT